MRKLMLLYLFGVLMLSCTKEGGNISVEGRVYNPITGEGIKNIGVRLIGPAIMGGAPGAQSSSSPTISSTLSDDSGYFHLSGVTIGAGASVVFTEGSLDLHVIGIGDNNVTGVPTYNFSLGLNPGKHNKVDFWVVPYGEITFRMENVNCEGIGDTLIYRKRHQYSSSFSSWSPKWIYTGCTNIQPAQQGSKEPMGWHIFEFKVIRSSGITQFLDSVYVAENQLSIFEVYY